jgi:hypothetical protein
MRNILAENQKNFPSIKSCRFIGLESMRKMVFHSISLKRSWLQTNRTQISQKTSIIDKPKSTITFSDSQMVSLPRARENRVNIPAKKTIRYKNLFLTISLNVLRAILNILRI